MLNALYHPVPRPWPSRFVAVMLVAALAPWAPPARGFVPDTAPRGEVSRSAEAITSIAGTARSRALDAGGAWQAFRSRNGNWSAQWNGVTGTPHRATGPAIPLPGFTGDSASIDGAIRAFVASDPELFGRTTRIEARSIRHHGNVWYASYRQLVASYEVLFADWEFRVSDRGQLMLLGADAWPLAYQPPRARITASAARMAAVAGTDFVASRDDIESMGPPALLPGVDAAGNFSARLVEQIRVRTSRPIANWMTLVDAENGAVLLRVNQARPISGHVSGLVHPHLPTDPLTLLPFVNELVFAGGDSATTDATGAYAVADAGLVQLFSELRGPFVDTKRLDLPPASPYDASVTATLAPGATFDIAWGDSLFSHDAERDAFYHGNIAHAYAHHLEPGFTGLDYSMPILVNYPYAHCNAVWAGVGIYLFSAGQGCVNTATASSVLYHEYGHAVNDKLFEADGFPAGMLNSSLQEATADVFAAFLTDTPEVGGGFFGPGTFARTVFNRNRWPEDEVTDVHVNGQIVGGSFWDLRRSLGLPIAERLAHQAKHGHPDDVHDFIAFSEMFLEVLVADDDDGNLANGTPHAAAIAHAFSAHGIGPNSTITIEHTPAEEPLTGGTVPVSAAIHYGGPGFTALDETSPAVHYTINGGAFTTLTLSPSGGPDQFGAVIPAAPGSVVAYYITARDGLGDEARVPAGAPQRRLYQVVTGPALPAITWDMEVGAGWAAGVPDDDATWGIWVRVDPTESANCDTANFIVLQPANDHTVNGTQCWVTGNADTEFVQGSDDVDGGKTTLVSPIFDALPSGTMNPIVEYWRWYSNNCGSAVGGDVWRTEISNDGGRSWVPLETTSLTANSWERVAFRIEDVLAPSHFMRLRFIANDDLPTSLVEAALDDVRLLVFPLGTAVAGPRRSTGALDLAAALPNPSRGATTMRLSLPSNTRLSLSIYDIGGRRVRMLNDEPLAAGEHLMSWDGLDDGGQLLPAGLYFARLAAGNERRTQRIVRIR